MDTEIKNAVIASGSEAQYDESAKRLLGQKIILAGSVRILDNYREALKTDTMVKYRKVRK